MTIYTDGACSSTDKTGGWAAVVVLNPDDEVKGIREFNKEGGCIAFHDDCMIVADAEHNTTNNAMELTAVLWALALCAVNDEETSHTIYTDSAYVANCFKDKWYEKWERSGWITSKREPVANKTLWEMILRGYRALQEQGHIITFVHVKGHSTNKYNNLADSYAIAQRLSLRK